MIVRMIQVCADKLLAHARNGAQPLEVNYGSQPRHQCVPQMAGMKVSQCKLKQRAKLQEACNCNGMKAFLPI
jgi:hypothetical protein